MTKEISLLWTYERFSGHSQSRRPMSAFGGKADHRCSLCSRVAALEKGNPRQHWGRGGVGVLAGQFGG
jgi:hypothetical protein